MEQGVIRVCFDIALNSKSLVNQATSKAMLTQMISILFWRMETGQVPVSSSIAHVGTPFSNTSSENVEKSSDEKDEKNSVADALLKKHENDSSPSFEEFQNLASGADIKGLEAVLDQAVRLEDGKKVSGGISVESMSVVQNDALLLFRTLCKMGMNEEGDEVATKMRLLSLELLQGLLEGVDYSFTKNFHFIDLVKAYLSYALLRASVSSSPVVLQYATGIFAIFLLRFRESLKGEIGIFFPLIVLKSLESNENVLSQRTSVLRMLEKVCKDSQMLADIFVNYDCDLQAPSLFERMVNALSKIAQGIVTTDPNSITATQIASAKGSSLQCLVSVLKSLVDWEKLKGESDKHGNIVRSLEEEVSATDAASINEQKNTDDGLNQFEKTKAHKSTMEAAILEVFDFLEKHKKLIGSWKSLLSVFVLIILGFSRMRILLMFLPMQL